MLGLSLENITKIYPNQVVAVQDFSLNIEDKEFIVLVGPSGCGKSTILRMIAGLETISNGTLFMDGKQVNEKPPRERNIAMVFQNYALYPHMTVFGNIAFALKMQGMKKVEIKRKVEEIAENLDISTLLKRKPKELSGGQKQRVALGRAMVRNPSVFLFDEPLSNLDAKLRGQMRIEISELHKKLQTTFIYVTHDQVEAMTMADRIVVMKDGIIMQLDTPRGLYDHPNNIFVAGFIGMPSMNFFCASIIQEINGYFIEFLDSKFSLSRSRFTEDTFKKYLGKGVIVGIRPEHITLAGAAGADSANSADSADSLVAEVDLVEDMGMETVVYMHNSGEKFAIRLVGGTIDKNMHTIEVCFDTSKVHLFDKETTVAL